jgi:hypothetical protein
MTGRHEGISEDLGALKSAVWLLGFGACVIAPLLGLVTYAIYAAVGKPPAYMLPLAIALATALVVWLCGDLANTVLRKLPRTPADLRVPLVASQVSLLAFTAASLFLVLALDQGWASGPARYVLVGTQGTFVVVRIACKRILDRRPGEIPE